MNIELVKALDFFWLVPPLNSENEIKKKYKKLSMKYHPDRKWWDEDSFKLLGKYKEILEKNFEKLKLWNFSEFKKIKEDFYKSKETNNSEQNTTKTTYKEPIYSFKWDFFEYWKFCLLKFLYKIYIEKLKIKIITISIFLLIILLFLKLEGAVLMLLLFVPIWLFFKSSEEENIYSYKDISIFFWISYYITFLITNSNIFWILKENSLYVFIFYTFILPILWFFFFRYWVRIIKNIFIKITTFISYIFMKITNFVWYIIEKILIFCLYTLIYIIPISFFTRIENIIEPIEKLRESPFYTLKILILYWIFLIIYTKLYKKYLKSDKLDTVDKIFYFTWLYLSLFLIINLVYFIVKFFTN
jgi:hypothetical protein